MMKPWRLLPMAVALGVTVGTGVAAAQTVIVRSAPKEGTIEVQVNAEDVASAKADTNGDATLPLRLPSDAERGVRFYVDTCQARVRVRIVEQGLQPASPEPGCTRSEVGGVFVMRPVTSFVVDLDGSTAAVHLKQGPPPLAWIRRGEGPEPGTFPWGTPPKGLQLSAGAGFATFGQVVPVACGNVSSCTGKDLKLTVTAEGTLWITRFLAAQVSYMRPAKATATGTGDTFGFNSTLDARILTVAANLGGPVGPVRIYAQGGLSHHQATFSTTETIKDTTVVVDTVTQTIKGGTQAFELKTAGWGWLIGGGLEAWTRHAVAFYVEGQSVGLKGSEVGGGEGALKDRVFVLRVGARVHIGR